MAQNERPENSDPVPELAGGEEPEPAVELPSSVNFPPPPNVVYSRPLLKNDPSAPHMPGQMSRTEKYDSAAKMGGGVSAGITFAMSVVVGLLIGQWIDHRFEPNGMPWGTIGGTLLGFGAGFTNFLRITTAIDRNANRKK